MGKDEDSQTPVPYTDHMASQVVVQRKSRKPLFIVLGVVVMVVIFIAAWFYASGSTAFNQDTADTSMTKEKVNIVTDDKNLSPEERISASLSDTMKKQTDTLRQNDDTKYIQNATSSATVVGKDLSEQDL